jgi:hypothetical protein
VTSIHPGLAPLYLVLFETSGNQAYIFASNKLREVIGASQCVHMAGQELVFGAVKSVTGVDVGPDSTGAQRWGTTIESENSLVELIAATSGKALLLVRGRDLAQVIVTTWSRQLLERFPGLDATAAISSHPVDLSVPLSVKLTHDEQREGEVLDLATALHNVHSRHEEARGLRRSPLARFQQLPIVGLCVHSGLPASTMLQESASRTAVAFDASWVTKSKRDRYEQAKVRLREVLGEDERFSDGIDQLESSTGWLGILHADGNGLGALFLDLPRLVLRTSKEVSGQLGLAAGVTQGRLLLEAYRSLSVGIDVATKAALREALQAVPKTLQKAKRSIDQLHVLPVVLGGDDLTAIVTGGHALAFTHRFLSAFMRHASDPQNCGILPVLAGVALGAPTLGVAAGLAICKVHYPFSLGYELASSLCDSAKLVKRFERHESDGRENGVPHPYPAAAIDFHVHFDSTSASLAVLRQRLEHTSRTLDGPEPVLQLTAKPYVIEVFGREPSAWSTWSKAHDWRHLEVAVRALQARNEADGERPALPRSQVHAFRQSLFGASLRGATPFSVLDLDWERLRVRYESFANMWSLPGAGSGWSLAAPVEGENHASIRLTPLLDAFEICGDFTEGLLDTALEQPEAQ